MKKIARMWRAPVATLNYFKAKKQFSGVGLTGASGPKDVHFRNTLLIGKAAPRAMRFADSCAFRRFRSIAVRGILVGD